MTVLVTGASGFVGRHLCRSLSESGWRVRAACRASSARYEMPGLEWVEVGEIDGATEWSAALDGVDCVAHLASLAHQIGRTGQGRAAEFMRVNRDGTRRLAHCAAQAGVRRIVFISSIGAICSRAGSPVNEDAPPAPDTDYGRSKLEAESALRLAVEGARTEWCVLRPPLVYGSGNPGNMARLLKLVKRGVPLPAVTRRNRRSFVFVGNLVHAIQTAMSHPKAAGRTFHVADSEALSTAELAAHLAAYAGRRLRLVPAPVPMLKAGAIFGDALSALMGRELPLTSYSLERLCASLELDCSAIRRDLGWQPPYSLPDGIRATLAPAAAESA